MNDAPNALAKMAVDARRTASEADVTMPENVKAALDKVDLLLADLGQLGEFNQKAERFVEAATTELKWNMISRAASVIATLIVIFVLMMFLRAAMSGDFAAAFASNPYALSVLVGGSVGGTVILLIALTRAVHATFAERNAGMPVPEHLKTVLDTVKTILPKS